MPLVGQYTEQKKIKSLKSDKQTFSKLNFFPKKKLSFSPHTCDRVRKDLWPPIRDAPNTTKTYLSDALAVIQFASIIIVPIVFLASKIKRVIYVKRQIHYWMEKHFVRIRLQFVRNIEKGQTSVSDFHTITISLCFWTGKKGKCANGERYEQYFSLYIRFGDFYFILRGW